MSATMQQEITEILQRVRQWTPEQRLVLAERLLSSLHDDFRPADRRGLPPERVRGLAATGQSPPDDDTVRQWVAEQRLEKYGT